MRKQLTRRQFYSRLRKRGFTKSPLQMSRNGITYTKGDGPERVTVTVPTSHSGTFHILGDVPYSGIYFEQTPGRTVNWGNPVPTQELQLNMFEVCLGLVDGGITIRRE